MRILVLLLPLLFSLPALAEVYRWVDEDGKVHYGDIPRGEQTERLRIQTPRSQPAEEAPVTDEAPATGQTAPAKETPFAAGKVDASAEERCAEFRARVKRYQDAGDMYIDNPDGTRHKLAAPERERLISRTQAQADQACEQAGL